MVSSPTDSRSTLRERVHRPFPGDVTVLPTLAEMWPKELKTGFCLGANLQCYKTQSAEENKMPREWHCGMKG